MTSDEIHSQLAAQEAIAPSSGFVEAVMQTVHKEALVPAPIPFPWKLAVPSLAAIIILLPWCFALLAKLGSGNSAAMLLPAFSSKLIPLADALRSAEIGWIFLALTLSFVSVTISAYLADQRHRHIR